MTPGGAGVAQRHDQPTGGPAGRTGIGYEPGRAPGARSAVVDGPYGGNDGMYGPDDAPYAPVTASRSGDDGTDRGAAPDIGADLASHMADEVLAGYLHQQSADFLRSLRLHRESGSDAEGTGEAAWQLRRAARRISATLYTFRPLTEEAWADQLRSELGWLSGTLAREQACAARRERLMAALQRLTGRGPERGDRPGREERTKRGDRPSKSQATTQAATPSASSAPSTDPDPDGALSAGAARAGALLDRQLTLARTRAHSAALQALGSSRFHAVADSVAVLASEAPLARTAAELPADEALPPLVEQAHRRLTEAVAALPLSRAGYPYNAAALAADQRQDAPWHQVRMLVRLSRYARELIAPEAGDLLLAEAGRALEWHRDAAEAAAAAAAAARTPRIAPATAYALGVLHADQRHEVEAARFAFGRVWLPRTPDRKG
ncbi:CHAD domain-containing protein [Streptomyces sp. NEAU-S7GS2]|uniref:CHAD domain-containing protein n=1 Tax=Streptomyces sp. NEAU-S7GS2 TaxID=2202000 RepID=UPI000D6EB4FA|nr:CHAD domain-containing protein [Streptomyces sp. NEAU-S7GS2]AWN28866.1 metal-binding protein [Streptomyces sp. NEAU-S7GS2]